MKTYGIIGHPLGHTFSRTYFSDKFKMEKLDAQYLNFDTERLDDFFASFLEIENPSGFNVTIPHKKSVIPFLDSLSKEAQEVGAVNVIKLIVEAGQRRLIGHNSDIVGFEKSLTPMLQMHHDKALVLGTGGAAQAVIYVLKKIGITYKLVSRTPLAEQINYNSASSLLDEYTLIINTTPLGSSPRVEEYPMLDYEKISPKHYLFDLIYNPAETSFLRLGREQGAQTKNGHEMLILQAEKAWEIWNS